MGWQQALAQCHAVAPGSTICLGCTSTRRVEEAAGVAEAFLFLSKVRNSTVKPPPYLPLLNRYPVPALPYLAAQGTLGALQMKRAVDRNRLSHTERLLQNTQELVKQSEADKGERGQGKYGLCMWPSSPWHIASR